MAMLSEVLWIVGGYLTVFIIAIGCVAFFQRGMFLAYFRARLSNGRKVLIKCFGLSNVYYKVGKVQDGFLIFKDVGKAQKRIALIKGNIIDDNKVKIAFFDPESNNLIDFYENFKGVPGFDAERMENLYLRTLYRPITQDLKLNIILVVGVASVIAGVISSLLVFMATKRIDLILQKVQGIETAIGGLREVIQNLEVIVQ